MKIDLRKSRRSREEETAGLSDRETACKVGVSSGETRTKRIVALTADFVGKFAENHFFTPVLQAFRHRRYLYYPCFR